MGGNRQGLAITSRRESKTVLLSTPPLGPVSTTIARLTFAHIPGGPGLPWWEEEVCLADPGPGPRIAQTRIHYE